jgi:hypothetical protein
MAMGFFFLFILCYSVNGIVDLNLTKTYDYNILSYTQNNDLDYLTNVKFNDSFNYQYSYLLRINDAQNAFIWNRIYDTNGYPNVAGCSVTPINISFPNLTLPSENVNISAFGFNINYSNNIGNGITTLEAKPWTAGYIGTGHYLIKWNSIALSQFCRFGGSIGGVGYGQQESGRITFNYVAIRTWCSGNISVIWTNTNISQCMVNARTNITESQDIKPYVVGNFTEYALYLDMNYHVYSLFVNGDCGDCCFKTLDKTTLMNISKPILHVERYNSGGNADVGFKAITNFRILRINEIAGYTPQNNDSINSLNGISDIYPQTQNTLDQLGFQSTASKYLMGILILIVINIAIIGFSVKNIASTSAWFFGAIAILNVVVIIGLVIFGLLPAWLIYLIVLISVLIGALLFSKASGG